MVRLYPIIGPGDVFATRSIVSDILRSGIRYLQLRGGSAARTLEAAKELAPEASETKVTLVVNDRVDIALLAGCGVHLGQSDLSADDARRLLGWDKVIGLSTHNRDEALTVAGADYVAVGPVFPTDTKQDTAPVIGLPGIRELSQVIRTQTSPRRTPVVAIGGITPANFRSCIESGADLVAAISALRVSGPSSRLSPDAGSLIEEFEA